MNYESEFGNIKLKKKELANEWTKIKHRLKIVIIDMAEWVTNQGYDFVITDLLSEEAEDVMFGRVSKSHLQGRACDVRCYNWPVQIRKDFESHFEEKYKEWAAISKKTLKKNLIEIHDVDFGIHCHVQISPYEGE